ncbi:MAG: LysR family transcriptional regulator [Sphingomonas sp.]|nr:MAG: LysR family transcriptional regulator [Sphingomonas sp.]
MELRHLRSFVQLATDLHFARAAAHLGMSQPPLSQQIRALEEELGVKLFERTSRRVALTPAGAAFREAAQATLDQAERAKSVARRAAAGELGELAIGFNASAPFVPRVAGAIHAFRETYPGVRLTLAEVGGDAALRAVADGELDLLFLRSGARPQVPEGVALTLLLHERLFVALREDHPLAAHEALWLRDLRDQPLLLYARERGGAFTEDIVAMLRAVGVEPKVAQVVREVATLFGLAAAGIGITIVSDSLRALRAATLAYRPLRDASASTAMWLIYRRDGVSLPCRRFIDIVSREPDGSGEARTIG